MTALDYQIFFLSLLPVTELRATIPLAQSLGLSPLRAFFLAVAGNLLPILPLLWGLEPLSRVLRYLPAVDRLFQKILARTRAKGQQVNKYGILGLFLFVAVPLPGTGAYTGAILAWLLGLHKLCSFFAIAGGVIFAGIIVSLVSMGVLKTFAYLEVEILLGVLLLALIFGIIRRRRR